MVRLSTGGWLVSDSQKVQVFEKLKEFATTEHELNAIELCIKNGGNAAQASKQSGITERNFRKHIASVKRKAAARHYAPEYGINNPLPEGLVTTGLSQLVDNRTGESVLTWHKSKTVTEKAVDSLVACLEELSYKPAPVIKLNKGTHNMRLLTLYTLTDFHLGMYAWAAETGDDWDTEIASKVLMSALTEMIDKSPDSEIGVLNIQGDFLHWDGLEAITPTSGHILDADTRFSRMIDIALDLVIWSIEMLLKKHKKVKLIVCEGNHDIAGSAWLRKTMKKIFKKNKRCEIDDSEFPYYGFLHGSVMLAFHHGHKKKNKDLPALFSSEPRFREMWGKAKICYIHTGHYHHTEQAQSEEGGAIVERHPTLASRDAYAARGGYVSISGAHAITYDIEHGEVDRKTVRPRNEI